MRKLKEEMGEQAGPMRQRPASLTWVRWVELAGARVRGSGHAPVAHQAQQLKSAVTVQRIHRGQKVRRPIGAGGGVRRKGLHRGRQARRLCMLALLGGGACG